MVHIGNGYVNIMYLFTLKRQHPHRGEESVPLTNQQNPVLFESPMLPLTYLVGYSRMAEG